MSERGFSLLELLVAMAVMVTLAAISIPLVMRARLTANESAAVANVRMIQDAQVAYSIGHPEKGYTCNLGDLGPSSNGGAAANADLIDDKLVTGKKSGYLYEITGCNSNQPNASYTITAVPEVQGSTGTLFYCVRQDGVIKYSADGGGSGCILHGVPLLEASASKTAPAGGSQNNSDAPSNTVPQN